MRILAAAIFGLALCSASVAAAQDPNATPEEAQGVDLITNGDPSDDAEGRRLLEIAAAANRPEAMNNLSYLLRSGIGGPADRARGDELLRRAAELGSIGANLTISEFYVRGIEGYPRDLTLGLEHARRAAEATTNPFGASLAQFRVGSMILNGIGTPADPATGYTWLLRAANNGSTQGMNYVAALLATGRGVAEDDVAAREWYRRASISGAPGSARALLSLGGIMIIGEGGDVDVPRGYAYLLMAQEAGEERVTAVLQMVNDQIDDRARAAAPAIIAAWRAENPAPVADRDPITGRVH